MGYKQRANHSVQICNPSSWKVIERVLGCQDQNKLHESPKKENK